MSILNYFNKSYSDYKKILEYNTVIKESTSKYIPADPRITELEKKFEDLTARNTELINFCIQCLDTLNKHCGEKDETIQRLSVQFFSLVAANQVKDNLNSGHNNIK